MRSADRRNTVLEKPWSICRWLKMTHHVCLVSVDSAPSRGWLITWCVGGK